MYKSNLNYGKWINNIINNIYNLIPLTQLRGFTDTDLSYLHYLSIYR